MASRATKSTHVAMAMHEAVVSAVRPVTPHLQRVTLQGETLRTFADDGPDQRCKLLLPRTGQAAPLVPAGDEGWWPAWQAMPADVRPVIRTYTVRSSRPAQGEIDLDMILHGDSGPGSAWATRARPGDRVAVYGAYAEYDPPVDARQLLVGDQTALPAVAAIVEQLDPGATGHLVLEVPDAGERIELVTPAGLRVQWFDADPVKAGATLRAAVRELPDDTVIDYAWVCADQDTAAAVRRHLVRERGLAPQQVMFMGYWRTDGAIDDV